MYCVKCGKAISATAGFCPYCGAQIGKKPDLGERPAPEPVKRAKRVPVWPFVAGGAVLAVAAILLVVFLVILPASSPDAGNSGMLIRAQQLYDDGEYREAVLEYENYIDLEPKDPQGYIGLADAYLALDDRSAAIEVLTEGSLQTDGARIIVRYLTELQGDGGAEVSPFGTALPAETGPEVFDETLAVDIAQVDISDFPTIRIYADVKDRNTGETPAGLPKGFFYLDETLSADGNYIKQEIKNVVQLNDEESLNIDLVADISGSMSGSDLASAQSIMINFLDTVQFGVGDKVELTAFHDEIFRCISFTTDKQAVIDSIYGLYAGGSTRLYEALVSAVYDTSVQEGAKCIIAFTDGEDNMSAYSPYDVVDIANSYGIPIFIVGIGYSVSSNDLEIIANGTGGYYRSIDQLDYALKEIYDSIFKSQKELYLIEYDTTAGDAESWRGFSLYINDGGSGGQCLNYGYQPPVAVMADWNGEYLPNGDKDPEGLIIQLDKRLISAAELDKFTQEQVAYIRNGIYALSGKVFGKEKYVMYFNSKSWYRPYGSTVQEDEIIEAMFNDIQWENWRTCLRYEQVRGWHQ